jgi:hypothetical protein
MFQILKLSNTLMEYAGKHAAWIRMAENTVSSVRPAQILTASSRFAESACRGEVIRVRDPVTEWKAKEDLKWYLLNKYRVLFTNKITRDDLDELQYCLRRQYDPKSGWNREYNKRFVLKMGEYMQEEILKSEIAGIESLLTLMKPEDLRDGAESGPLRNGGSGIPAGIRMLTGRE